MASGVGSYGGTPTTVTNTVMRWTPTDRRGPYGTAQNLAKDVNNQPRMLHPITTIAQLTLANGFTPANCRPGDMVVALSETSNVVTLCIRNLANNGWYRLAITGTGTPTNVQSTETADA